MNVLVDNAITGWWIDPPAMGVEGTTYFGAAGSDGSVLMNSFNRDSAQSFVIAKSGVDDHNGPAVWAESGVPLVCAWSFHNADQLARVRIGGLPGAGDALSFGRESTVQLGGTVSYAKLFRVVDYTDSNAWKFRLLVRVRYVNDGTNVYSWSACTFLVDKESKTVEWQGKEQTLVASTNNRVPYLSAALDDEGRRTVRLAIGYHPVTPGDQAPIRFATYDVTDNAVYNSSGEFMWSLDGDPLANRTDRELGYVVRPAELGSRRRRFLGVAAGPSAPAVLYAEWDQDDEDNATYFVASASPGEELWSSFSLGPAGTRIGHSETANYLSGAAFQAYPRTSSDVTLVRNTGSESVVERCHPAAMGWVREETASLPYVLARPISSVEDGADGLIASRIERYGSEAGGFTDFDGQVILVNE
ncbi:hypothetical protein [Rhodococcus sp. NBC_00294]|uniref:hypothetical protein n=1 Tax=Rhodococcus sp. NBC_00294 TaxID=2976004 RepID=UPI002E2AE174|nr:hypothetical protein [Rhodococcus sp. NBC_00294]